MVADDEQVSSVSLRYPWEDRRVRNIHLSLYRQNFRPMKASQVVALVAGMRFGKAKVRELLTRLEFGQERKDQ